MTELSTDTLIYPALIVYICDSLFDLKSRTIELKLPGVLIKSGTCEFLVYLRSWTIEGGNGILFRGLDISAMAGLYFLSAPRRFKLNWYNIINMMI